MKMAVEVAMSPQVLWQLETGWVSWAVDQAYHERLVSLLNFNIGMIDAFDFYHILFDPDARRSSIFKYLVAYQNEKEESA